MTKNNETTIINIKKNTNTNYDNIRKLCIHISITKNITNQTQNKTKTEQKQKLN